MSQKSDREAFASVAGEGVAIQGGHQRGRIVGRQHHGLLAELPLAVADLRGVHVELLGDVVDCLDSLEGFQGHPGLELGVMSFAFGFH